MQVLAILYGDGQKWVKTLFYTYIKLVSFDKNCQSFTYYEV